MDLQLIHFVGYHQYALRQIISVFIKKHSFYCQNKKICFIFACVITKNKTI